jgi:hypothetical protein
MRSQAVALFVLGLVAAGIVYGPLSSITRLVPGLALSGNERMLMFLCFVVAAFGALGIEAIASRAAARPPGIGAGSAWLRAVTAGGLVVGAAGVVALVLFADRVFTRGGTWVDHRVPPLPNGYLTLWVALAVVVVAAAAGFAAAGLVGRAGRLAVAGIGVLVLSEAWLFGSHYQPMLPPSEVPPRSTVTSWLQANAGDAPLAAIGGILLPDSPTLYGLHDVRTYDAVREVRSRAYWSAADPGYNDDLLYTFLDRPDPRWLARAGVRYVVTQPQARLAGTVPVATAEGVTIAEVSNPRPFALAFGGWASAADTADARRQLTADPTGDPVIEGVPGHPSAGSRADVAVLSRLPEVVELRVSAPSEQAVLVTQSYSVDWSALIDGRPAAVHPADIQFQAVIVPAGEHRVSLRYQPQSVTLGIASSGLGVLGVALLLTAGGLSRVLGRRRRVTPESRPEDLGGGLRSA